MQAAAATMCPPICSLSRLVKAERQPELRAQQLSQARDYLDSLAAETASLSGQPPEQTDSARAKLNAILARSEYAHSMGRKLVGPHPQAHQRNYVSARWTASLAVSAARHPSATFCYGSPFARRPSSLPTGFFDAGFARPEEKKWPCKLRLSLRGPGRSGCSPRAKPPAAPTTAWPFIAPIGRALRGFRTSALWRLTAPRLRANIFARSQRQDHRARNAGQTAAGAFHAHLSAGKNLVWIPDRDRGGLPRFPHPTGDSGMPSTLDPGDRKLMMIAGVILLVLIVVTVTFAPPPEEGEGQGIPTTYSTTNSGAQAAYLLLQELGYKSERWEKPPAELPSNAEGEILILAGPTNFPDEKERSALLSFVRSGGWIIYAGNFPFLFLETGAVEPPSITRISSMKSETFPAIAPSPFTQSAEKITMAASNRWVATDGAQVPLYGEPEEPVVVTWRLEKGRILWWAAPTPITNSGISRDGNLPFFLGCIQAARPAASHEETTVLWDEYFHGYRGSLWDYFRKTPVPWAIYQLALVAILYFAGVWPEKRAALRSGYGVAAFSAGICGYGGRLVSPRKGRLGCGARGLPAIPHPTAAPACACAFDFQHAAGRGGSRTPGLEAAWIL